MIRYNQALDEPVEVIINDMIQLAKTSGDYVVTEINGVAIEVGPLNDVDNVMAFYNTAYFFIGRYLESRVHGNTVVINSPRANQKLAEREQRQREKTGVQYSRKAER